MANLTLLPPALTKETDRVGGGVQAQMVRVQQEYDILFVCVSRFWFSSYSAGPAAPHLLYSVSLLCKTFGLKFVFVQLWCSMCLKRWAQSMTLKFDATSG